MEPSHISDENLERYYLGHISREAELALLEGHLSSCPACVDRLEESGRYVNLMRRSLMKMGGSVRHDQTNDAWFERKVAELKAELEKLSPERQEQFRRELEEGKEQ